uniref:C2H2-type domain-containing protein n=1 Tax=Strigamia maritima TaxID=126957 RepID=T1IQU8_STRMM
MTSDIKMAAPNHFGTNKQMDQDKGSANRPITQRISRSHKFTTRRETDSVSNNALALPSTSKPPFTNGFQHYPPVGMNYQPYSLSQLPNTSDPVGNNARSWPNVWESVQKYPLLQQQLNSNDRPTRTEHWANSLENYDRMHPNSHPNFIHEQNTVQISQSGSRTFQQSVKQNYMMATQTLRTFVNRSQERNPNSTEEAPLIEYHQQTTFSLPPLQPINTLKSDDLRRMAEMSKLMSLQNSQPPTVVKCESEKPMSLPNSAYNDDSDSDDLVIVPTESKDRAKCQSPITISSDESDDEKMGTSTSTPTNKTANTLPNETTNTPTIETANASPNETEKTPLNQIVNVPSNKAAISPPNGAAISHPNETLMKKFLFLPLDTPPEKFLKTPLNKFSETPHNKFSITPLDKFSTTSLNKLENTSLDEAELTLSNNLITPPNECVPDDSSSDSSDLPEYLSPRDTLEQQDETVSSLDTLDEMKNELNDTDSQVDEFASVITLRFCTVRRNADNIRELIKAPTSDDVFTVRQFTDKVRPCFKKKSRSVSEELVNDDEETVHVGTKRKAVQEESRPRKIRNIFSMPNLLTKPSPRKYIDIVICGKCKCRVADEKEHSGSTSCDFTDIYPCLDAKCEKTFIGFPRYQAHVEAHGYRVCEPKIIEDEEPMEPRPEDSPINDEVKCVFCDDTFENDDCLTLHLKQLHKMKNDSDFFVDFNDRYLHRSMEIWLRGLNGGAREPCKLCSENLLLSEVRNHLVEVHLWAKNTSLVRIASKATKKASKINRFIVPTGEANEMSLSASTASSSTGVILRKVQMVEPDTTREKPAPSLKDVEKWLSGLEDGGNEMGICCLFCEKMFLSAFATYRHLKISHGSCLEKVFGKNLLAELEDVEKSHSVEDGLSFCSTMSEVDRVTQKAKVLLMHFVEPDTRKAFQFDSSHVGEIIVRLLYSMGYSYCLFDENSDEDVAFDALCRNIRTFVLACVAPEVRNIVGFDTKNVEEVLDSLFEYIGVV